jgi:hypothetical protein
MSKVKVKFLLLGKSSGANHFLSRGYFEGTMRGLLKVWVGG